MRTKVLESIKKKLVRKMNELLEELEETEDDEISEVESENVIGDIVDRANSIYEMQIYDKLTEKERIKLQEIGEALKRIDEGVYGKCVQCGRTIDEKRLVAIPEAKKCIVCKSAEEKRRF
jgi:RNA polymerase-binding protein DksA